MNLLTAQLKASLKLERMVAIKTGDRVTMKVDAQHPRDHKAFCKIAAVINAGAVGFVERVVTGKGARKLNENWQTAVLVVFPSTAWANGVWSDIADCTKIVQK